MNVKGIYTMKKIKLRDIMMNQLSYWPQNGYTPELAFALSISAKTKKNKKRRKNTWQLSIIKLFKWQKLFSCNDDYYFLHPRLIVKIQNLAHSISKKKDRLEHVW